MCGIAGLVGPLARHEDRLRAMTAAIRHRGPDDADHWRDSALPVALGHRRLSIIDLRPEGRQPMASPSARPDHIASRRVFFPSQARTRKKKNIATKKYSPASAVS